VARLILDSGAIIAIARGDPRVAGYVAAATYRGDEVVVPAVVVAQTIRGGPRDAPVYRLLKTVRTRPIGLRLARHAGELLGATGSDDAVDAIVMAEALRVRPSLLLTSDPEDMTRLVGGHRGVTIVAV
jgi:predicted nucleic acid-binding protein